jgi:hypothetical protein
MKGACVDREPCYLTASFRAHTNASTSLDDASGNFTIATRRSRLRLLEGPFSRGIDVSDMT